MEELTEQTFSNKPKSRKSIFRSKFKKMSSQVAETEIINQAALQFKHAHMELTLDLTKSKKEDDEKQNRLKPVEAKNPQDYLNSITTTIDLEEDLELYSMDWCQSTSDMSVVGIKILSNRLIEAYGKRSYLLRGYHKGQKFFEIPLDIHNATIAYMMQDGGRIYAIDVGGQHHNLGITIDHGVNEVPMQRPIHIQTDFQIDPNQIQSFKLGIESDSDLKIVILTHHHVYLFPISLYNNGERNHEYKQNQKQLDHTSFNFKDDDSNDYKSNENKRSQGINNSGELALSKQNNEVDFSKARIHRILDFGVNTNYCVDDPYESTELNELLLVSDEGGYFHLLQGQEWGQSYQLYNSYRLRSRIHGQYRYMFDVLDAGLINNKKLMMLIKVKKYKGGTYAPEIEGIPSPDQCEQLRPTLEQLRIQIWEIDNTLDPKPITIDIPQGVDDNEVLLTWKQKLVLDVKNDCFYIGSFQQAVKQVSKINISNNSRLIEYFSLGIEHIRDFVGHHLINYEFSQMKSVTGLLYSDFITRQDHLFISHGRFISVININDSSHHLSHQILSLDNQGISGFDQTYYNHSHDVKALLMVDKNDIQEVISKWKLVALFNDGSCMNIEQSRELDKPLQSKKSVKKNLSKSIKEPSNEELTYLTTSKFSLRPYLVSEKLVPVKIKGKVLNILRERTNEATLPFIVLEKEDKSIVLATFEPRKQILKEYTIPEANEHTRFLVSNCSNQKYEDMLVFHVKDGDHQAELDQTMKLYKLMNQKIETQSQNKIKLVKTEELPKETHNITKVLDTFIYDNYLYMICDKEIQRLDMNTNEIEVVPLQERMSNIQVFEEKYFYWRQYIKDGNEFFFPSASAIYFESVDYFPDMKEKAKLSRKDIYGLYQDCSHTFAHLPQLHFDRIGNQMTAFIDYSKIKIFPLLHENRIKIKNSSTLFYVMYLGYKTEGQVHILGTKMKDHLIYSLHNDNSLQQWNIQSGKHVHTVNINKHKLYIDQDNNPKILDLSKFKYQQQINVASGKALYLLKSEAIPIKNAEPKRKLSRDVIQLDDSVAEPPMMDEQSPREENKSLMDKKQSFKKNKPVKSSKKHQHHTEENQPEKASIFPPIVDIAKERSQMRKEFLEKINEQYSSSDGSGSEVDEEQAMKEYYDRLDANNNMHLLDYALKGYQDVCDVRNGPCPSPRSQAFSNPIGTNANTTVKRNRVDQEAVVGGGFFSHLSAAPKKSVFSTPFSNLDQNISANVPILSHNQGLSDFTSPVPVSAVVRPDFKALKNVILKKGVKKSKKDNLIFNDFGIENETNSAIKLAEYIIIEILEQGDEKEEDGEQTKTTHDSDVKWPQNPIHKMRIKEIARFKGPNHDDDNNFGLYASDELDIFAFFYKDMNKNLQIIYYKLVKGDEYQSLVKICDQQPNTLLSTHSPNFRHYIKSNLNGELEVTPFYQHILNRSMEERARQALELFLQSDSWPVKSDQELSEVNSNIRNIYNISLKERDPSFFSKNEIMFMSADGIIMCYQIFDKSYNNSFKEVFNVTQCKQPGGQNRISLDLLFKLYDPVNNNIVVGPNCLIYQTEPHKRNANRVVERVAPNYFNFVMNQPAWSEADAEDANEMKYIQTHYKQKIEFGKKMYSAYLFSSRDFLGEGKYQTDIHIVNTFNYFQWRTISFIGSRILIEEISKPSLQNLSYCQLPNGKTILHHIKRDQDSIKSLYSIVYDKDLDPEPFYIPILEDERGFNVLQAILNNEKLQQATDFENFANVRNQVAIEFIKRIGEYPYDLFKIRFSAIIYDLIEIDIFQFCQFLEARCKAPDVLTQIYMAKVKKNTVSVMTSNNLWCIDEQVIRKNIEYKREELRRISMQVLDIASIHLSRAVDHANRFNINLIYERLADTGNEAIFSLSSVKALIEIKWDYIKRRIIIVLLIPYIFFLAFFTAYTCFDLETFSYYMSIDAEHSAKVLRALMLLFNTYFCVLEFRQIIVSRTRYLMNGWNYMDVGIFGSVYVGEIISLCSTYMNNDDQTYYEYIVRTLYSFTAILIWLRLLYYFRVFRTTGYYIRMVVEVMFDIRYFIFIFGTVIIAFTHAYFVFSKNSDDNQFPNFSVTLGYVYQLALGNYNVAQFGDYYVEISWLFFVLSTLMLQIALINLLISIVSDTFSRIRSNYNVIMYKDMLHMIIENRFLAVGKQDPSLTMKHLFMAVVLEDQDQTSDIQQKLDTQLHLSALMQEQMVQFKKQIEMLKKNHTFGRIDEKSNIIIRKLEEMEKRLPPLQDNSKGSSPSKDKGNNPYHKQGDIKEKPLKKDQ